MIQNDKECIYLFKKQYKIELATTKETFVLFKWWVLPPTKLPYADIGSSIGVLLP